MTKTSPLGLSKGLALEWFRNGNADPDFEKALRQNVNSVLVARLREILEGKINALEQSRPLDYDNLNWPYKQADVNGCVRTLRNVLKLISFNE